MVTRAKLDHISHVSANAAAIFGLEPDAMLGRSIDAVLEPDLVHRLRNAAGRSSTRDGHCHLNAISVKGRMLCAGIHRSGTQLIFEFEPMVQPASDQPLYDLLEWSALRRLIGGDPAGNHHVLDQIRALLGFSTMSIEAYGSCGSDEPVADAPPADCCLPRFLCSDSTGPVPLIGDGEVDIDRAEFRALTKAEHAMVKHLGAGSVVTFPMPGRTFGSKKVIFYTKSAVWLPRPLRAALYLALHQMDMTAISGQ